ncbi:MAG: isoleucine--tRNA ligase [Ignisphaera sp.]
MSLEELVSPSIKGRYDPISVEKWVMDFWKQHRIYEKVKKEKCRNDNKKLFRFLEGPPTTNGFMHVGHARGRTYKDVVLRYARLKDYCVWDQAGWDTQGLPVELEVERNLKFKTKKDIEVYGVDRFVQECQKIVDFYISQWRKGSERLGLWLDYDNAYETRNPKYIEVVWRFLKKAWEKGYLYEDFRVVPICPRCETALSSHEVAQGYNTVEDPSLFFKVKLVDEENTYLIAWTTTPWTIIDNEAIAVNPNEIYLKLRVGNEIWIVAEKRLRALISEAKINGYEVIEALKGSQLFNKKYIHPLLEEVPAHIDHEPLNHRILLADWVSMEEGTGIVHIAPAHGPEDFELCKKYGINVFNSLQKNGVFNELAGKYRGLWFKEANSVVIEDLRRKNLVVHVGVLQHEYPHCWRCETPLMFYADKQWFIKIEPIKRIMLRENEKVTWYPEWAGKRFSDWIENARDWCISRERYWGTPLPIWTCSFCGYRVAVESIEEIKKLSKTGEAPKDVHRPWIDKIVFRCPRCGNDMYREPYVVDVWMDSGVAHTASLVQINEEHRFNELFPYDWITEAVDQTRGWFYTLLFTSIIMHNAVPYKTVLCQGHVLDKYGKKMSKSRGNVVWALEFMERSGADPLRLYLLSKSAPWDSINFDPDEVKDMKRILDILWNSVNFAKTYMDLDKWSTVSIEDDLKHLKAEDYWFIYELYMMINDIDKYITSGDLHLATRRLLNFIVDVLSHKYITVIRPRVWLEEEAPQKRSAYATLFMVLTALIKVLAPFAPYISEYLYQAFTKRYAKKDEVKESVHIEVLPTIPENLLNKKLWECVSTLFRLSEEILAIRSKYGIKRRWPLKRVMIIVNDVDKNLYEMAIDVMKIYANVKEVLVYSSAEGIDTSGLIEIDLKYLKGYVDITVDEDLLHEGFVRDIVRRIQMLRKERNLPVDYILNRISIYTESEAIHKAVAKFRDYIARETRAKEVVLVASRPSNSIEFDIEDQKTYIAIEL